MNAGAGRYMDEHAGRIDKGQLAGVKSLEPDTMSQSFIP